MCLLESHYAFACVYFKVNRLVFLAIASEKEIKCSFTAGKSWERWVTFCWNSFAFLWLAPCFSCWLMVTFTVVYLCSKINSWLFRLWLCRDLFHKYSFIGVIKMYIISWKFSFPPLEGSIECAKWNILNMCHCSQPVWLTAYLFTFHPPLVFSISVSQVQTLSSTPTSTSVSKQRSRKRPKVLSIARRYV